MKNTHTNPMSATSLPELLERLQQLSAHEWDREDWADLPTFGGADPRTDPLWYERYTEVDSVWSWDADDVLIGNAQGELTLVPRAAPKGASRTPYADAVDAARAALAAAEESDEDTTEAEAALEAALDAWRESDETRSYTTRIEGGEGGEDAIEASSLAEAIELARDWARDGDYGDQTRTVWVQVDVEGDDGSEWGGTVAIDPDEPECRGGEEHDWQSPHRLLGGLADNPGVLGHGGGVICSYVCMRCGCGREDDSWAQDPQSGRQGLASVEYHVAQYDLDRAIDQIGDARAMDRLDWEHVATSERDRPPVQFQHGGVYEVTHEIAQLPSGRWIVCTIDDGRGEYEVYETRAEAEAHRPVAEDCAEVKVCLIRDVIRLNDLADRQWAYLANGRLPPAFDGGAAVPKRFVQ